MYFPPDGQTAGNFFGYFPRIGSEDPPTPPHQVWKFGKIMKNRGKLLGPLEPWAWITIFGSLKYFWDPLRPFTDPLVDHVLECSILTIQQYFLVHYFAICSYIMTEILMVWQPSQHLNGGVKGRSGLPTLCISAMILEALPNNCLIDVLCNKKYFLFVNFIFSVFNFP